MKFRRLISSLSAWLGWSPSKTPPDSHSLVVAAEERFREQIGHYDRSLAASVAYCDLLKGQIAELERSERELQANASQPSHQSRLASVRAELNELRERLAGAEIDRQKIARARDRAIEEAKEQISRLKELP